MKLAKNQVWKNRKKQMFKVTRTAGKSVFGQLRNGVTGRYPMAETKLPREDLIKSFKLTA